MTTHENEPASLEEELLAQADETAEVEQPEATEEPEAPAEEILEALEAPQMWDKRYKETFSAWGEAGEDGQPLYANGREWQQSMLDLFGERQAYATQVEQERARYREEAERLFGFAQGWNDVLAPYQQMIAESGATPDQFARQAFGLAQQLKRDPQRTILDLARSMNIDLRTALDGQEWESPESQQYRALSQRLDQMERSRAQREQRTAEDAMLRQQEENARHIQTFAEATDASGNLLHPHLDAVQARMAELIYGREAMRRSDPSLPSLELQEAYDLACQQSPEVAQAIRSEAKKKEAARKAAEAKKATDTARRVETGKSGKGKEPDKSLEDELSELYDKQVA